jgi:hypothetical protein
LAPQKSFDGESGPRHCGAVKFTAELARGFASARRCTCSIFRMRGAVSLAIEITHQAARA